jgi:hypothetical protein
MGKNVSESGGSVLPALGWGLLLLLPAAAGASVIRCLNDLWPDQSERVVRTVALAALLAIVLPVTVYFAVRRRAAVPGRAGLIVLAAVGAVLLSFYLAWVSRYVEFPADILIWSEGDFVNDIVKFRIGYPLYTAERNNDSFHYTPGAQLSTYALAWACGAPDSIPMYRLIQLFYCLAAAVVAVCCYWRLRELSGTRSQAQDRGLWGAVALPLFFLIATNSITDPFAHNLHNDALAQLISVVAYWLLLDYALSRRLRTLTIMAFIPALGFFVKQSLAIWAPLYCLFLLCFDSQRSLLRTICFAVGAFAGLALLLGGCYALWGEPFWYWTVQEIRAHTVSPLRVFQHALDGWVYYGVGLFAGLVFLRGAAAWRLSGPWLVWLLFLGMGTYTSGIEWMRNHMGPGCLLAGIWFLAALTRLWSMNRLLGMSRRPFLAGPRLVLGVLVVCLLYAGLGLVWMPVNPLPRDAYRYVAEIEKEFASLPSDKILIDVGAWMHARQGLVVRDQAPGIGTRGSSWALGDFSGILGRLKSHHYEKILVRNLDAAEFWYDSRNGWWPQSTGIRQALLENYQKVGRIKAVTGEMRFLLYSYEPVAWKATRYGFQEITILVPKSAPGPEWRTGE